MDATIDVSLETSIDRINKKYNEQLNQCKYLPGIVRAFFGTDFLLDDTVGSKILCNVIGCLAMIIFTKLPFLSKIVYGILISLAINMVFTPIVRKHTANVDLKREKIEIARDTEIRMVLDTCRQKIMANKAIVASISSKIASIIENEHITADNGTDHEFIQLSLTSCFYKDRVIFSNSEDYFGELAFTAIRINNMSSIYKCQAVGEAAVQLGFDEVSPLFYGYIVGVVANSKLDYARQNATIDLAIKVKNRNYIPTKSI